MDPLLLIKNLTMRFGGLKAVNDVSFDIAPGQITALIGPNGAGKTTLFNCISGIYTPTTGEVTMNNQTGTVSLNALKPHSITGLGLARTFQNIRLFANMSALENAMIGREKFLRSGLIASIGRTKTQRDEEKITVEKAYQVLKQMGLAPYVNELAANLPYGAQRKLEIARALATEPTLLLLDEPAAGMNPNETAELVELIREISQKMKITIFLIEHDMSLVMRISDTIYVMDYGKLIAQGSPEFIRTNPEVIRAYLGDESYA